MGWPAFRVSVAGTSMIPTFEPGERLLVSRWARWTVGSIIALPDPREPRRMLVKRIRSVGPDGVEVQGDNEGASTDSRAFGPVPPACIAGRVIYRYFPAEVAGRVR
ncbi:MAG: nickel-type superoxide dismutase maturation protease [Actinomycetota bacterium]|nr:nickel-type superoxide dismutase maturation protease [Actinomycetota bacterium]